MTAHAVRPVTCRIRGRSVRYAVRCVIATAALAQAVPAAAAEPAFPSRPVRIIVPLAPGGGTDNLTRIMAPRMSELLGQQIVVDNRPGAGGQIGTDLVAKAKPDGYTILNVESSFASNPSLFSKLPYDVEGLRTDFAAGDNAECADRPPIRARENIEGTGGARQAAPLVVHLRDGRSGHRDASGHRAIQDGHQDQSRDRALQERRSCDSRRAGRAGHDVVRWHQLGFAVRRNRKVTRDCRYRREAQFIPAQRPDVH